MFEKLSILLDVFRKTEISSWMGLLRIYLKIGGNVIVETTEGIKVQLRPNGIDYWIYIENLISDCYGLNKFKKLEFKTVVDIGANIGLFSCMVNHIWPESQIKCYEPNPESFDLLQENLKLNFISAEIIKKAVVSRATKNKLEFFYNENPAMVSVVQGTGRSFQAETISFSRIAEEVKLPALLKIDIEGGEYDIFTKDCVNYLRKFEVIVMEYHNVDSKYNLNYLESFFNNYKFSYKVFGTMIHVFPAD